MSDRHQVTVSEAAESIADIDAVWFDPDPHNRWRHGVRVTGYSRSRRAVLAIILVRREDDPAYWGATGGSPTVPTGARMEGANDECEA